MSAFTTAVPRVLALDIDGTLLNSRKEISPRNRAAIEAAGAAGVRIALVTGRRYPAARKIADLLPGRPTLVLHNGGLVFEESVAIRVRPLARDTAVSVLTFAKARGADPVVHVGHGGEGLLYVENDSPSHTLLAYYLSRSHPDVRVVENLEAAVRALEEDPLQVMFGGSMKEMSDLARAIEVRGFDVSALRTVYPKDDLSLIDVVAPSVDKSEALRFLCARWGVAIEEVLAIGDNWNDRLMLLSAGKGCVMGNADPELRALGLEVIPGNDEDGVAWAVERFVLRGVAPGMTGK
ncbi:MAG: Cof-type HAD-IIB family hydrolase [Vicinamibacteria bacterium]|nr:Cof-type HAD-IIB family hydrolase [Vicinamibacteria bacterium]